MKFKLAVVQFEVKRLAPEDNIRKAERFIISAANNQVNVIIFPEDFITDPLMDRTDFADDEGKYKKRFQALAKKYSIDIVMGSIVEKEEKGLFNNTYYIDANGEVLSNYKKINLWLPERSYITPGNKIAVFDTKYGKAGLIICWDAAFPELFRKMVHQGVKIVYCPSYWCYGEAGNGIKIDKNSEIKLVDALCVTRAFENELIFVYCNAAGESLRQEGEGTDTLIGHSQVALPFKGCIKKLDHNKEEMFIQEIDMDVLKVAEESKKIREDLLNRVLY
jgi:predicted amidohydrolase